MLRHRGDADALSQGMAGNLTTLMKHHQAIAVDPDIHQQVDIMKRHGVVQPVGYCLAGHCRGVEVARGSQSTDTNLSLGHFSGVAVDDGHGTSAKIHKQLVAGFMDLPHADFLLVTPGPVEASELRVGHAIRLAHAELLPEQIQRDVPLLQLLMDSRPTGYSSTATARTPPLKRACKAASSRSRNCSQPSPRWLSRSRRPRTVLGDISTRHATARCDSEGLQAWRIACRSCSIVSLIGSPRDRRGYAGGAVRTCRWYRGLLAAGQSHRRTDEKAGAHC